MPHEAAEAPEHVATLERVSVRYGDVAALDDVSLGIRSGEILGVVGESGAGKSTLLRLLDATEHPTSGRVTILGAEPARLRGPRIRALRRRIGMVFQGFNLLGNRTVQQNVALPLVLERRADPARVAELLDYVGLADRARHYPAQLSGGQRQRVAIARALVTRPGMVLADEPTSSLDTRATDDVLALLAQARADFGTTVVLVTHELESVAAIADRVAVLERGALRDVLPVARGAARDRGGSYADHVRRVLGA
ncbi:methionine ABC transporter ATP-binding protein [Agrococcus carbonis]|uniref:ABC transporter n=1 Tax=Agrococcus carbonis TaxID=684552 RepID=A0A1H1SSN0_9MICO|nr:methionine ABC transporter ATP-binding protein [Agrococcus carbonis]SDS50931.1 ABC transporter [Agrococcus carbonis]